MLLWRHFAEIVEKYKNEHEKLMYYMYNCRISVESGTSIAHDKPILYAKQFLNLHWRHR